MKSLHTHSVRCTVVARARVPPANGAKVIDRMDRIFVNTALLTWQFHPDGASVYATEENDMKDCR